MNNAVMLLEFNDIRKSYGEKVALHVPSWTMQSGEVVGLVGSNGAGKTTFLRLLLDLLEPDSGQVLFEGRSVVHDQSWRLTTGSFLDRSFLIEYLTIGEYLEFVGATYGLRKADVARAIEPFTNFLPVSTADSRRLIRDLSTGNAKKVGIAAALFVAERLLVLDEPFANLDPPSQIRLKQHLLRLSGQGLSMLISSHDLGHVTDVCSRITLIGRGEILRDEARSEETLESLVSYFSSEETGELT